MRNLSLGRRHLVNAYEVEAGIGVIAGNTVWSMPERRECEVLQKARYINTLTFTFTFLLFPLLQTNITSQMWSSRGEGALQFSSTGKKICVGLQGVYKSKSLTAP